MPIRSVFPDVYIRDMPIHELILAGIKENIPSGRKALINGETQSFYTYKDVYHTVHLMASHLHRAGLQKGDVVVICMPNLPEYALIFLATAMRGGITSGVNSVYTKEEMRRQFMDCKCKFIFTTDSVLTKVREASKNLPYVKKIYVLGRSKTPKSSSVESDFESLCQITTPSWRSDDIPPGKIFGTTGVPKGTMLSHYNMSTTLHTAGNKSIFLHPNSGDNFLGFLPFFHIYGFFVLLLNLKNGVTVITMAHFESKKFLEHLEQYKVKYINLVPPIMVFLAKDPMVSDYDISSVEAVAVGAAPVGKDISEGLMKRLPHIKYIIQGFGMTEVSAVSHLMPPTPKEELKHGSCGMLLPHYSCKIIHTETGKELGPNQTGEMCLKGVSVMLGYLNRPQATAETIDADGYLHTGDIAYYDDDGLFYVVDRLKELIKVKGYQVPPAELEDLLLSHDDIQDAAVIGPFINHTITIKQNSANKTYHIFLTL